MKAIDFLPDIAGWKNADGAPAPFGELIETLASRGYALPNAHILAEVYRVKAHPAVTPEEVGRTFLHVSCSARGSLKVIEVVMRRFFIEDSVHAECLRPYKEYTSPSGVKHVICEITGDVE